MEQDRELRGAWPPEGERRLGETTQPSSYTIPKLLVEDRITLPFGIEATWRQGGLLLLGISLAISCWQALSWLAWDWLGVLGRALLAGMPLIGALLVGWVHPLGRPLESWLGVLWRYGTQPRTYVWQPHPVVEQLLEGTDGPPGQEESLWDD